MSGDIKRKLRKAEHWMEDKGEGGVKTLLGGDFNARTGEEKGGAVEEEEMGTREKIKRWESR